jgi:hypothetical protein
MRVDDLTIKVTYKVGLAELEMPKEVYEQLLLASEKWHEIDPSRLEKDYRDAADWLHENIKEGDCMDWVAEVDEISEHDVEK